MNTRDPDSAKQLLEAALANPFGYEEVRAWFDYLCREFPLWSFQAWRYAELQRSKLPSNYPLQLIIASMCSDDGVESGQELSPLEAALDYRRYWLSDRGRYGLLITSSRGGTRPTWERHPLHPGPARFARVRPLPEDPLFDPEDPTSYGRHEREIVRQLAASSEGVDAPAKFQRILRELGLRRRRGPPAAVPPGTCKALVREGKQLFESCWELTDIAPSPQTKGVLAAEGVDDADAQQRWSTRLALPVLSRCELLALKAERREETARRKTLPGVHPPTAVRFVVWVVAHRLGLDASTLTRKARGHDAAYFKDRKNPIDKVC